MRFLLLAIAALTAATPALADEAADRTLLVWPAHPAAVTVARALAERAADRGAFEVVDAGMIRRRIEVGGTVDVRSFLGEAARAGVSAQAALTMNDPQRALELLEPAMRDFLVDLAGPEGRATLRDLLVTRARAHLGLHDPVAALADLTFAVRLETGGAIEENSLLPVERALVSRARSEAPSAPLGRLSVSGAPAGASVLVDGVARGVTPLQIELPSGGHVVRLDRFGRQPAAALFTVVPAEEASVRLDLPAAEGADLVEQIARSVQAGTFEVHRTLDLVELARATGAAQVLVVERGARVTVRLFSRGRFVATGQVDAAGPYDALWATLETSVLGHAVRTPGTRAPARSAPLTSRWWFWTVVGAVAIGGITTGVVLATQDDPGGAVRWSGSP